MEAVYRDTAGTLYIAYRVSLPNPKIFCSAVLTTLRPVVLVVDNPQKSPVVFQPLQ